MVPEDWEQEILDRLKGAEDNEDSIQSCVYDVLNLGAVAVPIIRQWLKAPHFRVRAMAIEALARLEPDTCRGMLETLMRDSHPVVLAALSRTVGILEARDHAEFINRALSDKDNDSVVLAALKTAGSLEMEACREKVEGLLTYDSYSIPDAAAKALGQIGALDSLPALSRALRDEDSMSQREMIEAVADILEKHGSEAFRSKYQELDTDDAQALVGMVRADQTNLNAQALRRTLEEIDRVYYDPETLRRFGTLLTDLAEQKKLTPAYHAEDRITGLRRYLEGPNARSVLLLGPSGVGKTALIHATSVKLAEAGSTVLEVRGADIVRGRMYLGQWQEHVLQLVEAARRPKPVVLYVPDINEWAYVGATVSSDESALSALRPYIQRGDVVMVAETTPEAFRSGIGRRPEFASLFPVINLQAATDDETLDITNEVIREQVTHLTEVGEEMEGAEGFEVKWEPDLGRRAMELAALLYSGQVNPGRTVSLVRMLMRDTARRITDGELEGRAHLSEAQLYTILHRQTGLPPALLDDNIGLDLSTVRSFFDERVIGQSGAIDVVVDLIALIKAGLTNPDKPLSVLMFVGPTGVGKTELGRAIAEYLFGSAERMIRIDMSEFQDFGAMERLLGHPMQRTGGLLTEPVREQPFCLVLLDEIEKAYQGVHDLLLQVFDSGRLTDSAGRTTSFRRAVVVMTSNLGADAPRGGNVGFLDSKDDAHLGALSAVEKHFRREFVNRFDHIVAFRSLGMDAMEKIARKELRRVLSRSGLVRRSVAVDLDPSVLSLVMRTGFSPKYGARPLKRAIEQRILVPIARKLVGVTGRDAEPTVLQVDARGAGGVRVRSVQPPSSKAPRIAIDDPFGTGRQERIDLSTMKMRARVVAETVAALRAETDSQELEAEKATLTRAVGHPDAWARPDEARERATRLHTIEELLSRLTTAERRSADLLDHLGQTGLHRDRHRLSAFAKHLVELEQSIRLLRYEVMAREEDDRSDAFIEIALVDPTDGQPHPLDALMSMYAGFAERHRFRWQVVFEERDESGRPLLVDARLEGVCAFGVLKGEAGLHRFMWRAPTSQRGARTRHSHARVRVLADRPRRPAHIQRDELIREESTKPGIGQDAGSITTTLRLTHRPTMATACVVLSDDTTSSEALALDLLAAKVSACQSEPPPPSRVVRRYTLSGRKEIRDDTTGIKTGRVEDVLAGNIDPFVLGRLTPDAVPTSSPGGADTESAPGDDGVKGERPVEQGAPEDGEAPEERRAIAAEDRMDE